MMSSSYWLVVVLLVCPVFSFHSLLMVRFPMKNSSWILVLLLLLLLLFIKDINNKQIFVNFDPVKMLLIGIVF